MAMKVLGFRCHTIVVSMALHVLLDIFVGEGCGRRNLPVSWDKVKTLESPLLCVFVKWLSNFWSC